LDHSRILAFRHQERAKTMAKDMEAEALDFVAFQVEGPTWPSSVMTLASTAAGRK